MVGKNAPRVSPAMTRACVLRNRARSYKNGKALASHILACHDGVCDPKCPACRELAAKYAR
jgi:hypothetical protein